MVLSSDLLAKLPTSLQLEGTPGQAFAGGGQSGFSPGPIVNLQQYASSDISHDLTLNSAGESAIFAGYIDQINQYRSAARTEAANASTARTDTRTITPSSPIPAAVPSKGIGSGTLLLIGGGVLLLLGLGYSKRR